WSGWRRSSLLRLRRRRRSAVPRGRVDGPSNGGSPRSASVRRRSVCGARTTTDRGSARGTVARAARRRWWPRRVILRPTGSGGALGRIAALRVHVAATLRVAAPLRAAATLRVRVAGPGGRPVPADVGVLVGGRV